uniref:Uncharacterized protein n=1 Tax=Glossina palpalis gambiensis TaxID=67801 RepID=A0A1B0B6N7_9MUSC
MSQLIRFITLSYVIHNTNPFGFDVNNIDESHEKCMLLLVDVTLIKRQCVYYTRDTMINIFQPHSEKVY